MAAPASAYFNNGNTKLPVHKVGVQKLDNLMAVFTAGYNTANQVKSLFKLDYLLRVDRKNADGSITATFVGACDINSSNLKYHGMARRSKLKLAKKDGTTLDCWVFVDAGLNTLPSVSNPTEFIKDVGNIQFYCLFKSSFYAPSTGHGYKYTINGGTEKTIHVTNHIAQNDLINGGPNIGDVAIQAGDTIVARAFIINEEGTTVSDSTISIVAQPRQVSMKYHFTYASEAYFNGEVKTTYAGSVEIGVGSNLYSGLNMEIVGLTQGYYVLGNRWYEVRPATEGGVGVFNVVATGECNANGWPETDPIRDNGVRTLQMTFFNASSFINPCNSYNLGNLPNRSIWLRQFDSKYYATETGQEFCENGWYVWNGIYRRIFNGAIVETGTCPISG